MKKAGESAKSAKVKKDNPEQSQRFVETAKELDVDESGKSFERALATLTKAPKDSKKH